MSQRQEDVDFVPFGQKTDQETLMDLQEEIKTLRNDKILQKKKIDRYRAYCMAMGLTESQCDEVETGALKEGKEPEQEKGTLDEEQPQGEDLSGSSPHGTPETAKDDGEKTQEQDGGGGSSSEASAKERRYSSASGGEEGSPQSDAGVV